MYAKRAQFFLSLSVVLMMRREQHRAEGEHAEELVGYVTHSPGPSAPGRGEPARRTGCEKIAVEH